MQFPKWECTWESLGSIFCIIPHFWECVSHPTHFLDLMGPCTLHLIANLMLRLWHFPFGIMSYELWQQKKIENQNGNLIIGHWNPRNKIQMISNWSVQHNIWNILLKTTSWCDCMFNKKFNLKESWNFKVLKHCISQFWEFIFGLLKFWAIYIHLMDNHKQKNLMKKQGKSHYIKKSSPNIMKNKHQWKFVC